MTRVARQDEAAFAALYDRHGRAAFGLAVRIVRDPQRAEEAVQDGFLSLWRTAGSFDPTRSAPSTWIHVLVHRRAVEIVRREARRETVSLAEAGDPSDGRTLEHDVLERDETRRTRTALDRLSDGHRAVLELAYYSGLTQPEIARRLCIPLGTVKSRTSVALARLGELLSEPVEPTPAILLPEPEPEPRTDIRRRAAGRGAPSAPRRPC